ncbi:Rv3235 family protein [Mycobacterium sp. 3519A]|uniref:Rv3235 family protein n=1 Tax=Mycobacterium sp. 3519A TaxID=2057184 RepID=UPI000C7C4497|nr:Rv3235 family protein [Mycobacterium sp. 3519A]
MTASRVPSAPVSLTTPIIDCEPPPVGLAACPPPSSAALHRRTVRTLRPVRPLPRSPLPPPAVVAFADAALRRILEVVDRRRPIPQLHRVVAPALIDTLTTLTRMPQNASASLGRVRVRMVDERTGELFATYTRGHRVRAIAGRIERRDDRWRVVALQIG